jgi:hypothetical protein
MDGAGGEPSVRRIGGRATQQQLPSVSDVAIYNSLILNQKIATLRLLPWMACMLKKQRLLNDEHLARTPSTVFYPVY